MINRTYSILMKGDTPSSTYFNRKTTHEAYKYDQAWSWMAGVLVPESYGGGYRQYCSDQLVQVVRKSILRQALAAFDPVNTYKYEFAKLEPESSISGLASSMNCDLLEPSFLKAWTDKAISLTMNTGTDTITVDGVSTSLAWDSTVKQSGVIQLASGLSMRLRGIPVSHTFNIYLVRPPERDLKALVDALRPSSIPWHADYTQYKDSTDPDTWLAAAVLSYCRKSD